MALLASEFIAAMHPLDPLQVVQTLHDLGFDQVETTVLGEELVAAAYEQVHARVDTVMPRLRSTCPVVTDWVRRFHPQLTPALVPIAPPYIVSARMIRALRPDDVYVVYVSPCWARKGEACEPGLSDAVDVVIGFDELKRLFERAPSVPRDHRETRPPMLTKQLSATDGYPRRTLRASDLTDREVVTVRGLADVDRLLSAIVRGETAPNVVDMLCCEGCIDGPAVNDELSVFAKRTIDAAERERQPAPEVDARTLLSALPPVEITRSIRPRPAPVTVPDDEEIDRVLAAGEFHSRSATLDCGACGYPTCVEHAAAILLGSSSWDLCFPLTRKRMERERERYARDALLDELTGLQNRRAFDRRLSEEVARSRRYGSSLSLIMLDLDRFKEVNDRHGHAVGDSLLGAVGTVLRTQVRESDQAMRYGGDEFAILLVNARKTEAWAVAEKVRSAISRLSIEVTGQRIATTASVGVASYGAEHDTAAALLEAADAALYRAKRAGRGRVEIAAG